jgi:hypothetical protein
LGEGAPVVFDVGGGGLGDGDADGHAEISLSEDWLGGTGGLMTRVNRMQEFLG